MTSIKNNILKILVLFIISTIFLFPIDVYASNPPNPAINPYDGLEDLAGVHVVTDDDGNVSITEVTAIRSADDSINKAWNYSFERYRTVIAGICGLCTLTFVLIFLVTFTKIASSTSNPQQRAELSKGLLWIGFGAAGFGSVTIILSLGFGLFKS